MGNQSSVAKPPFTEKKSNDQEYSFFRYGISEMQGWRNSMEDASLVHISRIHKNMKSNIKDVINDSSFDEDEKRNSLESSVESEEKAEEDDIQSTYLDKISLFGVFDGHGGSLVAKFCADNFFNLFKYSYVQKYKNLEGNFQHKDSPHAKDSKFDKKFIRKISSSTAYVDKVEQALIQTFLDLDELLLTNAFKQLALQFKQGKINNLKINNYSKLLTDNSDLLDTSNESPAYMMGTTANIVSVYNNFLIIANAGDSLSVLYSNGKAIVLNSEHKVSIKGEEDRILKSGFQIFNGRVDGKLNLTRAIGDLQFKDKRLRPYEQAVTAYPEVLSYELTEGAEFVVSGCDGIWDCVEPQKFCEYIATELKSKKKISTIIGNIQDMILSKTINSPIGTDNMTCYIIQIKDQTP